MGAIFPVTARINHSCRPNAQHAWNNKLQRMLVHAVREIGEGDELTLSYTAGGPSAVRKRNLRTYFGFGCTREACSLHPAEQEISDQKLHKAQQLDEAIGDSRRVKNTPEKALANCHALLKIYQEEHIFDLRLPRLYYDAFQITAMHAEQARASIFAQRSCETRTLCEGPESAGVEDVRALAQDPAVFENFGVTTRWRSMLSSVPRDVSVEEFERWLWKEDA